MSTQRQYPQSQASASAHCEANTEQASVVFHAVVPSAGMGQRFEAQSILKSKRAKQYHDLAGKAIMLHTVEALLAVQTIGCVWVVLAPGDLLGPDLLQYVLQENPGRLKLCHLGGEHRRDTVLAGLKLAQQAGAQWTLVHDAARPLVAKHSIEALMDACLTRQAGGILALPVVDTVKRAQAQSAFPMVEQTISREGLWLAQTPQCFQTGRLIEALERFPEVTDESAAIEQIGDPVMLIKGERSNIKLTFADDLKELEMYVSQPKASSFRVGEGYDVHALVPGRALKLGGIKVDYPLGLLGHSDADVLLHAITDALLGAAGLGDIGMHFPDHDKAWHDADSRLLLSKTVHMLRERQWQICNLDCTVVAQRPRLATYREDIIRSLADCLDLLPNQINCKAKTQELLGFEGRGEGISARAVVLIHAHAKAH